MMSETEYPPIQNPSATAVFSQTGQAIDPAWAWARYAPGKEQPWTVALAGHLYRRAAFGASWEQLQEAVSNGPNSAIESVLRPGADIATFNRKYDDYEAQPADSRSTEELRAWWLQRMLQSPHPLLEKMTLFWHNHFAASNSKVNSARLMQHHLRTLRSQALGNYRVLLKAMVHDSAMFLSVDARTNRKALPNEHFPRWLLETHAAPGDFSDRDVKEAARAFTGWFVIQDELREIPREHDTGLKRILGHEGPFHADDVVHILLDRPSTAQSVVRKIYCWLISETAEPAAELITPLVETFSRSYELAPLIETVLRSNLFFSRFAYRQRIKCPVEFSLGIVKGLEGTVATTNLAGALTRLGQNLLHPPTTKGWSGGRNWINHVTLAGRLKLAAAMLQKDGPLGGKLDPLAIASKYRQSTPDAALRLFLNLYVQGEYAPNDLAMPRGADIDQEVRRLAYSVIALPEFQLA